MTYVLIVLYRERSESIKRKFRKETRNYKNRYETLISKAEAVIVRNAKRKKEKINKNTVYYQRITKV